MTALVSSGSSAGWKLLPTREAGRSGAAIASAAQTSRCCCPARRKAAAAGGSGPSPLLHWLIDASAAPSSAHRCRHATHSAFLQTGGPRHKAYHVRDRRPPHLSCFSTSACDASFSDNWRTGSSEESTAPSNVEQLLCPRRSASSCSPAAIVRCAAMRSPSQSQRRRRIHPACHEAAAAASARSRPPKRQEKGRGPLLLAARNAALTARRKRRQRPCHLTSPPLLPGGAPLLPNLLSRAKLLLRRHLLLPWQ